MAEMLLDGTRRTPHTPALFGSRATACWAEALAELCGGKGLEGLPDCNERRLRELLLERLPAQGIPPAQVLGMAEELHHLADEGVRWCRDQSKDFARLERTVAAIEADARRASGVATRIGRATGARVVNWCDTYKGQPGDDDRLERCEVFSVTALEGGALRLESASGVALTVAVGTWGVGRSRVGDRFHMEVRSGADGPQVVRVASAAPLAATRPEPDPAERPDVLGADQVVRLHVSPSWAPRASRDVELLGSQTLDDLHAAIKAAFEWKGDHLYLFRLGRAPYDVSADYLCEECRGASQFTDATLASLVLYPRRRFWYVFDFGDEALHEVEVVGVGPRSPRVRYPRLVVRRGKVLGPHRG